MAEASAEIGETSRHRQDPFLSSCRQGRRTLSRTSPATRGYRALLRTSPRFAPGSRGIPKHRRTARIDVVGPASPIRLGYRAPWP